MFPVIQTIDDVLPFIKGNDNFSINHKDGYIVIDYILNTPDLFKNEIEKECRGIIFDAAGKLISRRLHKFFNFNERPESSLENIDFSKNHWILEKLDGSMITPFDIGGRIIWGSKAGETFLTPQIEKFVYDNPSYKTFADWCIDAGITPIFEWCTLQNRIVIDYPKDRLVLIAMRWNSYGDYCPYYEMIHWANIYGIDVVKTYPGSVRNIQELSDTVKGMTGIEGFVVRFEDGQMIKIKCDEYIRYHKAKDAINLEKNVITIIVNNQGDDFKSLLSEDDKRRFEMFEGDFWFYLWATARDYNKARDEVIRNELSRKEYALSYKYHPAALRSIIFDLFDIASVPNKVIFDCLVERVRTNCSSVSKVESVRHLFGEVNWNDYH